MLDKNKIKNIIFDLDNTILLDTEEYLSTYVMALEELNIDKKYAKGIWDAVEKYDYLVTEEELYYSKEKMLDLINKSLNQNFDMKLIDKLIEIVGKTWIKDILIKEDLLKELSKKYNLYIFTSFFEESQKNRIINIGYNKYFKDIFGADRVGTKPYKQAILNVLKSINGTNEDTIIVGDTKGKDVLSANYVNMKSILLDRDGTRDRKDLILKDYIVIKDMSELKNLL